LRLFARHYETGAPIPAELVGKLNASRDFGKGVYTARQMFYASLSLNYYDTDPQGLDATEMMRELAERYSPYAVPADTHVQCGFTHLDHYSAFYYTYMWSLVIAKDLLSRFEQDGLLNERTARAYRQAVLDPGGSKPAAELVADFLGRPYNFEAFTDWLNRR
jgi:thimet oligopeptidase